jgi:hypothetical protein
MKKLLIIVAAVTLFGGVAIAGKVFVADHTHDTVVEHSGGTNAAGCHNETRTGGYHCH